jgi:nucleoid-associated protein Lsr2
LSNSRHTVVLSARRTGASDGARRAATATERASFGSLLARYVIEKLVDDLDGSEATETVSFGLDRTSYEIDLNKNAVGLRKALHQYVTAARKGRSAGGRREAAPARASRKAQRDYDIVQLREWAGRSGVEVPSRGRIPRALVDEYRALTPRLRGTAIERSTTGPPVGEAPVAATERAHRTTTPRRLRPRPNGMPVRVAPRCGVAAEVTGRQRLHHTGGHRGFPADDPRVDVRPVRRRSGQRADSDRGVTPRGQAAA